MKTVSRDIAELCDFQRIEQMEVMELLNSYIILIVVREILL
ncbi:hypothetical protein [Sulfurospirillum barnesii]|nr:hypothetical protein [Sulfurospirillum barnesii]